MVKHRSGASAIQTYRKALKRYKRHNPKLVSNRLTTQDDKEVMLRYNLSGKYKTRPSAGNPSGKPQKSRHRKHRRIRSVYFANIRGKSGKHLSKKKSLG